MCHVDNYELYPVYFSRESMVFDANSRRCEVNSTTCTGLFHNRLVNVRHFETD